MFDSFQYTYLLGDLFFLLIWIILFIFRRDLRKEIFIMSLVVAPMGPMSEFFYLRDYWHPELFTGWAIGIEDLLFSFNSIYVSILSFLIIGASILFFRHDLLKDALLSGLLVGILMFIFYFIFGLIFDGVIQKWWMLKNISGILVFSAPLEELMWGFGWGFVAGPAYEFI